MVHKVRISCLFITRESVLMFCRHFWESQKQGMTLLAMTPP